MKKSIKILMGMTMLCLMSFSLVVNESSYYDLSSDQILPSSIDMSYTDDVFTIVTCGINNTDCGAKCIRYTVEQCCATSACTPLPSATQNDVAVALGITSPPILSEWLEVTPEDLINTPGVIDRLFTDGGFDGSCLVE